MKPVLDRDESFGGKVSARDADGLNGDASHLGDLSHRQPALAGAFAESGDAE